MKNMRIFILKVLIVIF